MHLNLEQNQDRCLTCFGNEIYFLWEWHWNHSMPCFTLTWEVLRQLGHVCTTDSPALPMFLHTSGFVAMVRTRSPEEEGLESQGFVINMASIPCPGRMQGPRPLFILQLAGSLMKPLIRLSVYVCMCACVCVRACWMHTCLHAYMGECRGHM